MVSTKRLKRIAVLVPTHRIFVWHQRVLSALRRSFEVDVYTNANVPSLPLFIGFWLGLEKWILGHFDLVGFSQVKCATSWEDSGDRDYAMIINLSERPTLDSEIPTLEARYQNELDSLNLYAVLMARKTPYLSFHLAGNDRPIVASYLAIPDKIVLSRGLQNSFSRLIALTQRAANHVTQGSEAAIVPHRTKDPVEYSLATTMSFSVRFILDKLFLRFLRKLKRYEHWSVALLDSATFAVTSDLSVKKTFLLADDRNRFYADPFLFEEDGRSWLFVEEFEYRTGKGVISCAEIKVEKMNFEIDRPRVILERPYHLSYPFVFRNGSGIYMIPESGDAGKVELFRARSFPFEWEPQQILLEGDAIFDASIFCFQDRWWLFAAISECGNSPQDELAIFYSDNLEGPWRPHRKNPVKSDCRSARPAGRILIVEGRPIRPAQNCEHGYGTGIVWCQIDELTPDHFAEREIGYWSGKGLLNAEGIHTFNNTKNLSVIDLRRTVWKR